MATANVLITFHHQVAVTIKEDKTWSVSGDPGGLLEVEGGTWKYTPPSGTELIGGGATQIVLINWKLSSAVVGIDPDTRAFLFPGTSEQVLGSFEVTQLV